RGERQGRVTGRKGESAGARAIRTQGAIAADRLFHGEYDAARQDRRLEFIHAEMLEPALPFSAANQVGPEARPDDRVGLPHVLARLEECLRQAGTLESSI